MLHRKEYIRYSRQIMLPQFGEEGQEKLREARVAVFGLGGLGSPVLQYLTSAGVGHFTLIDDDDIALDNLHRQLLYREADIGKKKVEVAADFMREINPTVSFDVHSNRLAGASLEKVCSEVDLILDCTDTVGSRLEINKAAAASCKAHVVGTGIRLEGQVISFDHSQPNSACFACVMSDADAEGLTCAESGVMGPVLGVIGSTMAMSAIKYFAMPGEFITNQWQFLDALKQRWMTLDVERSKRCVICN